MLLRPWARVLAMAVAGVTLAGLPAAARAQVPADDVAAPVEEASTPDGTITPTIAPLPLRGAPSLVAGMTPDLVGKPVEAVVVTGNRQTSTAEILNQVRTREGEPFDPDTVVEDYQRIFSLRKFANVQAIVEPTGSGVRVVFQIAEQPQILQINVLGNLAISTQSILNTIDVREGESIDRFRISMARQAIESLYRRQNFPNAHVDVDLDAATRTGKLVFKVTEGSRVRVRKVEFVGNTSFTDDKLSGQVRTRSWIFVFRSGAFDQEQLEDDVASVRRFYESKGFFDVRVGRKVIVSPDQSEIQVNFLIDEGKAYTIERITFRGNDSVSEIDLRKDLKLTEGRRYDADILQRDIRKLVRKYSPLGYIYQPQSTDPDYLQIDTKQIFEREPGRIELIYDIREGKPFRLGRVIVKGNQRTQDKVVLRELRVSPGQMYNAGELQDAIDRLRGTPFFETVSITPIGTDKDVRDLLIEVRERRTASLTFGGGVSSNGGVGGNITYEQRNFDIGAWPHGWGELFDDRTFVGAGQSFRATVEPGNKATNASIRFTEPWLFDQPYSFSGELYLRNRVREDYDDDRIGGRIGFGKRFNYVWSAGISLRGEDVKISDIDDPALRAPEILEYEGHNMVTAAGISVARDTTQGGLLPYMGTRLDASFEQAGALGGDFDFQKYAFGANWYIPLYEDLLERRTILSLRFDTGYIGGDAPFFERFYGGGIGTIRGFDFRGVSPRSGPDEDRIGGDFIATGTAELSFPIAGEQLRGVVFTDLGTVEPEFELGTLRASVGAGIRLTIPLLGQAPLAVDFAWPVNKDDQDDTRVLSFSFGVVP